MNGRSDWIEGDDLYQRAFLGMEIDPESTEADIALTFLWRSGRWREARHLLALQGGWMRPASPLDVQLDQARLDAICRLEIGAEFAFDAAVEAFRRQDDLRARVSSLASEPTLTSLIGAGLSFALHHADAAFPPRRFERRVGHDPVGAAVLRWDPREDVSQDRSDGRSPKDDPEADAVAAVEDGWKRITGRVGEIDVEAADRTVVMARSAAVLTPFADLIDTMSRLPRHDYLREYAAAVQQGLDDIGTLAPANMTPWHDRRAGRALALQAITDLGLLVELAGAAAYLRQDRDLRLVAAAAERWRRTVGRLGVRDHRSAGVESLPGRHDDGSTRRAPQLAGAAWSRRRATRGVGARTRERRRGRGAHARTVAEDARRGDPHGNRARSGPGGELPAAAGHAERVRAACGGAPHRRRPPV